MQYTYKIFFYEFFFRWMIWYILELYNVELYLVSNENHWWRLSPLNYRWHCGMHFHQHLFVKKVRQHSFMHGIVDSYFSIDDAYFLFCHLQHSAGDIKLPGVPQPQSCQIFLKLIHTAFFWWFPKFMQIYFLRSYKIVSLLLKKYLKYSN